MAFKIDGRRLTADEFRAHVAGMTFSPWGPSGIAVHNTANPSLHPLKGHGSWYGSSITPAQRVQNLAAYYSGLGWRSGPHMFIDADGIWLFTPLNKPGTHSPSWNGTRIGIEMVGDYDIEPFDSGDGKKVRDNTVASLAALCAKLRLEPNGTNIKLHKEDPRTTHDCPGKNVRKDDLLRRVVNFMGDGGDHSTHDEIGVPAVPAAAPVTPAAPTPPSAPPERAGVVTASDGLTLREFASASSAKKGSLPRETVVTVLSESWNGETKWLRVKTPSGFLGWVSAKYVDVRGPKKPRVDRQFIVREFTSYGWSIVAGYGVAANSFNESSFDPDAVGDHGKAYGLFQWHGDRQSQFKQVFGKDMRDATAAEQVKFVDWELRNTERKAGDALKAAKTAREAGEVFCRLYERAGAPGQAEKRGALAQRWFDEDQKK